MVKFATFDGQGNEVAHDYGNRYFRQPCGDSERLVIGPTSAQTKLLDELAATFPNHRYYILYVLLVSHSGQEPGRFQSPLIENHEDLQLFIWSFQEFFEGDGRHHLWIASPDSPNLLVYDQHDVIFGYGTLDTFEKVLTERGFTHEEFWFPAPHVHSFSPENVRSEEELFAYWDWRYFELQPDDEWE